MLLNGRASGSSDATDGLGRTKPQKRFVDVEIANATDKLLLCFDSSWFARIGMTADEERIIRVGRRDTRHSDTRFDEDVIDRQGHHILGFDGCHFQSLKK